MYMGVVLSNSSIFLSEVSYINVNMYIVRIDMFIFISSNS